MLTKGLVDEVASLSNGREVPRVFAILLDHVDRDYYVDLQVKVDADGRPVCTAAAARPRPGVERGTLQWITAALEDLPDRSLREWVRYGTSVMAMMHNGGVASIWPDLPDDPIERQAVLDSWALLADTYMHVQPGRRRAITSGHLKQVAEVYRLALDQGQNPTQAVQDKFVVSHSTAARWVMTARKQGHLGKAHPRRAGEALE